MFPRATISRAQVWPPRGMDNVVAERVLKAVWGSNCDGDAVLLHLWPVVMLVLKVVPPTKSKSKKGGPRHRPREPRAQPTAHRARTQHTRAHTRTPAQRSTEQHSKRIVNKETPDGEAKSNSMHSPQ